jgi:hypothetical protein
MAAPFRTALLAGLFLAAGLRADEPAKPKAPPTKSLDAAKLPPNAVLIVSDNPRDALNNVDAVVLTPDEYKKLLESAEQAKRLATPDKPEPPSVCRLSGRIEARGSADVVVLRAEFRFRTTSPRSTVLLGLQKGKPVAATMDDGKLAVLVPFKDDDGFAVEVDTPGEHRVAVDLEVPVTARGSSGGERGVELGLPGAAITAIEKLVMPAGVARVRLGGRSYPARQFIGGTETAPAFLLGPTTKLELGWDVPASAEKAETQTTVDGRYDVRVEDRALVTHARLTFKVQGGPVGVWEIHAPPAAELTAVGAADVAAAENPVRVQKPANANRPWVVRRDPSTADLVVEISLRTAMPKGRPAAVPGFTVTGAAQQRGTFTVSGPPHLRLTFLPAADVSRREAADDAGVNAVFSFYRLPESGSPLEIDVQPARGDVETQLAQQFTLGERGWRWQGKFDVHPVRTDVTAIDLEVPAELQELRPASAELVEGLNPLRDATGGRRVVRVQLAEARRKAFTVTLDGLYPASGQSGTAALSLVRPLGTLDRGGQLVVSAPAGLEVRGSYRPWEQDGAGQWEQPLDPAPRGASGLVAMIDRAPARLDLTWRSPRADVPITATVDIQLGDRQATVRHQWRLPAGLTGPRPLVLRGPAPLAGRVRAVGGGTLSPANPGEWSVQLGPVTGRESVFIVAYSFAVPNGPSRLPIAVPLVWLEPWPRCETDVRVWSAATPAGILAPAGAAGPWTEVPPRAVPDRPTLPALAVHAAGTQLPLTLSFTEAAAGPGTGLVIDRVWVQAVIDADGQQAYRTRCLVRPQQTHYLDVELPAPPASAQFTALLDGKRLPWTVAEGTGGRFVRLRLDPADVNRGSQELDLAYLLPPRAGDSRWQLTLTPPRLRGPVFVGPVRWQVGLASGDLLVDPVDAAAFDWRWGWQRGLLAPLPAWSAADLRRWFTPEARPIDVTDRLETALVGWQPAAEPLQFLVVPRPLALLVVSLAVLVIGWVAVRVGPAWRVGGLMGLVGGLVWLAIDRPQMLAVMLYAAQPGAVVLVVMLTARWAARRRYRRQVLFLPGFARPSDSSRARASVNGNRPRREPTPIDLPAQQAELPAGEW